MNQPTYPLLNLIDDPSQLRELSVEQLDQVADELRQYLIHTVSDTGGHLAAGLGTVELTIALHYVFNTPSDRLIWDVGHQTYPHKILTGRRDRMPSMRKKDGLSGFPKRDESPYDAFGVGHSSTSISAALGMALAAKQQQKDTRPALFERARRHPQSLKRHALGMGTGEKDRRAYEGHDGPGHPVRGTWL